MNRPTPTTILFDADEVIQTWTHDHRALFATLIAHDANVDAFITDIYAAEAPCLSSLDAVAPRLTPVLSHWRSSRSVADVLTIFTRVQPDPDILQLVRTLRRSGIRCHLASNQHAHRASYMAETLGYAQLFDSAFYSCHIGAKKPDPAYFTAVLEQLRTEPECIVFIDDLAENVAAARQVGFQAFQFHISSGAAHLRQLLTDVGIAAIEDTVSVRTYPNSLQ
jgi:putative hydrolase of the HAD superfamily